MAMDPRTYQKSLRLPKWVGANNSALDDNFPNSHVQTTRRTSRVPLGRLSIPQTTSFFSRWRGNEDSSSQSDRPPIPSALTQATEIYASPLPVLSMIVLSIAMLGEFLSANVSAPFLLFMVEGFGGFSDDADVGFWTGILASCFFLTQFLTSLLWATVASKHGQRAVLCISLFGSAITCFLFGTCTSMRQAVVIRLLQGIFAGAIGVARGAVTIVTDQSNEGRAYAILGFCWGLGGVVGAIIGATFESPTKKWPTIFARWPFFADYPYLLPCAIASAITLLGAVLALFLGPDGGPRQGAIRLPDKEINNGLPSPVLEEVIPPTEDSDGRRFGSLGNRITRMLSGRFSRTNFQAPADVVESTSNRQSPILLSPSESRRVPRTSRANGSAYGYTGSYRHRLTRTSIFGVRQDNLAASMRYRRASNAVDHRSSSGDVGELNFSQRLLMANENVVTNISDLWVSAAMNVDNEIVSESDSGSDNVRPEPEEDSREVPEEAEIGRSSFSTSSPGYIPTHPSHRPISNGIRHESLRRPTNTHRLSSARQLDGTIRDSSPGRRRSASATIPLIFSHSGVRTPPAFLEAQQLLDRPDDLSPSGPLERIVESGQSVFYELTDDSSSLYSQLPIVIIVHYGLLALHSTTHDQVFYLYLVSKYPSGGLNLNAGHFGQLIALMCFFQIAYQFYLYPNIGPPRGRFSHLAMFRLGSILFVPAYLSVILFRALASAENDGGFVLMTALALSTALRYCGSTFAYTAISVLLNYMSPPHLVGFANGIAQTCVSFSRFLGPIVGGTLWSMSVEHDPKGYPLGFLVCAGVCALAVLHSFFIR